MHFKEGRRKTDEWRSTHLAVCQASEVQARATGAAGKEIQIVPGFKEQGVSPFADPVQAFTVTCKACGTSGRFEMTMPWGDQ